MRYEFAWDGTRTDATLLETTDNRTMTRIAAGGKLYTTRKHLPLNARLDIYCEPEQKWWDHQRVVQGDIVGPDTLTAEADRDALEVDYPHLAVYRGEAGPARPTDDDANVLARCQAYALTCLKAVRAQRYNGQANTEVTESGKAVAVTEENLLVISAARARATWRNVKLQSANGAYVTFSSQTQFDALCDVLTDEVFDANYWAATKANDVVAAVDVDAIVAAIS